MRRIVLALLILASAAGAVVFLFTLMTPRSPAENLTLDVQRRNESTLRSESALAPHADTPAIVPMTSEVARDPSPVTAPSPVAAPSPVTAPIAERAPDMTVNRDTVAAMTAPRNEAAAAPAPVIPVASGGGKAEVSVGQKDRKFTMASVDLTAGEKITFVNNDSISHNIIVTTPDRKLRNSGVQEPGQSATVQFDDAGKYDVECAIHPQMRMTVQVK
jgi:cytochrome c peroxidase